MVKKNETATVEIANTPMSTLEIRKVDSVTGKPLSGITFEVEKLSGERIGTFVTDAAGRIVIPDLTPQWVVVKETKTRPGYKLDPDPVNVEIKSGKTTVVKFQNQPYPVLDFEGRCGNRKTDGRRQVPFAGQPKTGNRCLYHQPEWPHYPYRIGWRHHCLLAGSGNMEGYELDESLHKVSLQWGKTSKITSRTKKSMDAWRS